MQKGDVVKELDPLRSRSFLMAIDIGGTFTDIVLLDRRNGLVFIEKVISTPVDPSQGSMEGFHQVLGKAGVGAEEIEALIHSTTVATNAVIERKGARTALVATAGFKDLLEIGRENRYDIYDLLLELPDPLVERFLRKEINERTDKNGNIQHEPSESEILRVLKSLRRNKFESLAVCFLHSYMNSANEEQVGRLAAEHYEAMFCSLSSRVAGEIREYERTVTTVVDAYIKPIMVRYLEHFERALVESGFRGQLFIMLSKGGIAPARQTARDYPVRVIESGPAAGALMARFLGGLLSSEQGVGHGTQSQLKFAGALADVRPQDHRSPSSLSALSSLNLLSFDMGGTTAKACLITEDVPTITHEFEVARVHRFKKGSGFPLKISSIELIEIGAGGGSIARVDEMGLLKVGPDSSGADPGPCCYDRGGIEPTVTDADLALGYLDPDYFLGGAMQLNEEKADRALGLISARLGVSSLEAAWGIHDVVNENMVAAIRVYSAEKGVDLRRYTLVAFGGAGPVHAYSLARKLHITRILCPHGAGVASAIGSLVAPPAVDFVKSYICTLATLDWERVNAIYQEMEEWGREVIRQTGISDAEMVVTRMADMRYVGQGYEITVPIPNGVLTTDSRMAIEQNFWDTYYHLYRRHLRGVQIEGVSWRVTISGPGAHFVPRYGRGHVSGVSGGKKGTKRVYFRDEGGHVPADVYDRYELGPGFEASGPAIVQEKESTVVVGLGSRFFIDEHLNLIQIIP